MAFLHHLGAELDITFSNPKKRKKNNSNVYVEKVRMPEHGMTFYPRDLVYPPEGFREAVVQSVNWVDPYETLVSKAFGKTFRFKKAMKAKYPPHCTICQEPFKSNEKIRTLHTEQCSFHARCIDKWFEKSIRCPNCNVDCEFVWEPDCEFVWEPNQLKLVRALYQ